jgi:hypothetical protein
VPARLIAAGPDPRSPLGRALAQREVGAKTNEIPGLAPCLEGLDLAGTVSRWTPCTSSGRPPRLIREVRDGHYVMVVKRNQPGLHAQLVALPWTAPTPSLRKPPGPRRDKAMGAGKDDPSAPLPPTGSTGPALPRPCASAATPALPAATGPPRRSPTASPASRQTSQGPSPGHLRPPALGSGKPSALRPRRHLPRE